MGKWGCGKFQRTCRQCTSIFFARHDRPGIFCSRKCQTIGRKKKPKILFKLQCQVCEKEFYRRKGAGGTYQFCSIKCMSIKRGQLLSGQNHPKWKGGISERPYRSRMAIKKAKEIKKECEKCGSSDNLQGHHKIKYSLRPDLCDLVENIEVICARCHAKEHPELECMISIPRIRKGFVLKCHICGKDYYVPAYKEKTSKCCSRKCSCTWAREIKYGKRHVDK